MADPLGDRYMLRLPPQLQEIFEQVMAFVDRGNWPRAGEALLRMRSAAPRSIPIMMLSAMVMLKLDRYREAHSLVMRAADPPINVADLLLQEVQWLRRFEEPAALERVVTSSDWRATSSAPWLAELALHLGSSGLYALALECLDHALKFAPNDANLHYLRGLFEMFSGHTEASIAAIGRALSIKPGMPNAHLLLSMQDSVRAADEHIAQMQRALQTVRRGSEEAAYLYYSLHQRLDAKGRHGEAWQALECGHAARRSVTAYNRQEQHALFKALKGMALPGFHPGPAAEHQTGLIFIVGMFRSGTTLIERVLAGHPDVVDGGETYQFSAGMRDATDHDCSMVIDATIVARAPAADFGIVRRRMQAYANWRSGGRRWLTEKLPSNFLNIGFILQAMPEARILHMRRDPVETCFSNLRTFFSGAAPYACDQQDLADYYLHYETLMAHWHASAPGRILDVDYRAFIDDPESQAQRVLAHCGLTFVPEVLDVGRQGGMSATASSAHVRRDILKNRAGAWKPYEQALQPMIRMLQAAEGAEPSPGVA